MLTREKLRKLRGATVIDTNKLRIAKQLAKVTQTEIAERIGLPQSQVSEDINGHSTDLVNALRKARAYADLFGCTVDDLFPRDEASA